MKKLLIMAVGVVVLLSACDMFGPPEVEYYVNASGPVDITISGKGESTEQFTVSSLPWRKDFTASKGDFVYVSAQVKERGGWVETKIEVNGKTIDSARSQGDFVIATSSGSAE